MHMPDVSGLDVQRDLGKRFPVIAVSGNDEPSLAQEALKLGGSAFLVKPLESDELLRTVADSVRALVIRAAHAKSDWYSQPTKSSVLRVGARERWLSP
jgi:FixJ family two-component response regulator